MAHTGTIIYMRNVPEHPDNRALTQPLECLMFDGTVDKIPVDFEWDGSSSEINYESKYKIKKFLSWFITTPVNFITRSIFPRHKHPIASCRHDYRCGKARNAEERFWADKHFEEDVGTTSSWVDKKIGYAGVRVGALLGIGNNF